MQTKSWLFPLCKIALFRELFWALRKRVARLLLVGLVCLFSMGQAWADKASPPQLPLSPADKAWLAAHPIIRLGIDARYAPYSFLDEQGQLQGVVSAFLAYLEPTLGVRFEIVSDLDWPQLMTAVQARRIDAVATVVHLPEREAFLEFTSIYLPTPLVIMTRNDTPQLHSLEELHGLNLALVEGYSSSKQITERYPDLHPRHVATPLDGLSAVATGTADAYLGVLGVNTFLAARHGFTNLKANAALDMGVNGQRFGVRKDWPQLARILDQALRSMPIEKRNAIFERWMPLHTQEIQRLSQPSLIARLFPWLIVFLGLAVLGYLFTLLWNRQLKRDLARRVAELATNVDRLRAAETMAHLGHWQYKVADDQIEWSDEAYRIFDVAPLSQPMSYKWLMSRVHPDDRAEHDAYTQRILESRPGKTIPEARYRLLRRNGEIRFVRALVRIEYDISGKPHTVFGTIQDITEQVHADERIVALNRLYRVLSGINEAIVRLRDAQALFEEACRIAVDVGGFRMAWLGMIDADPNRMRPRAHAGWVGDYLENLHISLGDDERAHGPTGTALREDRHVVCNDIATDPHMAPWRETALALGYRASAAFPIRVDGQVRGVFNLYADHAGFFDEDELRLLDELAEDIGFALEFIEATHAREALNGHMLDLLESMSDGFVSLDRGWHYQYVNRKAGELFGRAPADLVGKHIWTEFPEGVGQPFHQAYEQAMNSGKMVRLEDYYAPWDQWYENRICPTQDGISIFFTDITEHKKREAELKRLHTTLHALVEGSTDAIFVKNKNGQYIVVNQALSALVGKPKETIMGADDYALFSEESAKRFRADDQRIKEAGTTVTHEEQVTSPTGTYSYLTTKGPLIIDDEVCGVFGISRDITARKLAEAALLESETRLRLFIEHAPAALAMFDHEMRYLSVSTHWLSDYHLASDILGQSHYQVFPEIPERWKAIHSRGLAGEVVVSDEDRFERADGTVQWLRWEVRPWYTADGVVGGIVVFSEDITDHIVAEQAMHKSEARFGATFEQAAMGLAIVSPEGRWLRVNQKLCEIVGYDETELLTATFQDITHPDDLNTDLDHVRQMLAHELDTYSMEKRYLRKDGNIVWTNLTASLVWKSDEEPDYFISVIEDISARKAVETALHESEARHRLLFEQNPVPMLVYEKGSLRLLTVNDAFMRHYGYSHDEALALRLTDLYPDEEKPPIIDLAAGLVGLAYAGEWHHVKKDGSLISIEARSHDIEYEGLAARVAVITDITARKLSEQALQASESRFRTLASAAPVGIFRTDAQGACIYVNPRWCTLAGMTEDEALGDGWGNAIHPEDRERVYQLWNAATEKQHAFSCEYRFLTPEGQVTWVMGRSLAEFDSAGQLAGYVGTVSDITPLKQIEEALTKSEARYRSLLERAPFPAVLSRVRDGMLLYGNHRAEIQYGIKRELGIGQPAEKFYEDASQRERFLEPLQKTGKVDDLEVRMLTADGRPFWALVSASIVEFDNEPAIFTAINDITARKQMEAALREQEAFFRLIAENMGDMVAVLDLDGRRLYNSPSYRALFGDPEALKGTDSFAEIHPDDRDTVREVFMETVRTGQGHRVNFRFVLPDGSERHIESQGGVIRGVDDQVERVVVVSRDVTERRQMEDEIRQFNTELEERVRQRTAELAAANKEMETFTYSVSHDLKAPLRGIEGYSRLLLEDYQERLDQAGCQLVNNVRHGVAQMSQLIEDLLTYSRMERRSLQDQAVDLAQLMDKVLETLQADIQAQGMVVATSLQNLTAHADPNGLAIVLRNLVDNALKFSRDSHPPTLSISGSRAEKSIILKFTDNGIGFDMQFHNRIFDIFQRLQRAEDYPGTGVGLAIVSKAMQRMGGRVWAESVPGQGATFYLELPL